MTGSAKDAVFLERHDQALPDLYGTTCLDDFVVTAMRILPQIVASDITSYNEVNIGARRVKSIMDSSKAMSLVAEHPNTFNRLLIEENPLVGRLLVDRSKPLKISDFVSNAKWRATTIHRRFFSRLGLNFQMAFALSVEPPTIVAFALNRKDRDFSEEDRSRLLVLQTHMTNAYQNALRQETFATQRTNRGRMIDALNAGWIELDASMEVSEVSPMVTDAFVEFFKSWGLPQKTLPDPIRDWLFSAIAAEPPERTAPFVTKNNQAILKVSLFAQHENRHVSLLVERISTGTAPEDFLRLGLTPRQSEILFWISQGKSNADVAVILRISSRTVENHVARILDTLGVSNRTQAASLALGLKKR